MTIDGAARVVREGDAAGAYEVVEITPSSVLLRDDGAAQWVRVGSTAVSPCRMSLKIAM